MQIKSRHRVDFSPQMAALWACLALGVCISSAESAEPQGLGDPGAPSRLLVHASRAVNEPVALTGRNARVQLVATVEYDSGQLRDWTRDVKFTIDPPTVARVDDSGLLVPLLDGEAILRATAGRLSVDVPVAVTSFAEPPLVNFPNEIVPVFTKLGCNSGSCHGKAGGKNGFSLSLLGFEPADDFGYLVKEGRGRRLFPAAPDRSLLLQKACGSLPHGGGVRMPVDSDEYRLVRLWVKQGMPYGSDDDPVLAGVRVHPSYVELPSDGRQQLKVIAQYSDGSHRDVTRQAQCTRLI